MPQYVIVGGGISGLFAALKLVKEFGVNPKDILIIEQNKELGGQCRPVYINGKIFELANQPGPSIKKITKWIPKLKNTIEIVKNKTLGLNENDWIDFLKKIEQFKNKEKLEDVLTETGKIDKNFGLEKQNAILTTFAYYSLAFGKNPKDILIEDVHKMLLYKPMISMLGMPGVIDVMKDTLKEIGVKINTEEKVLNVQQDKNDPSKIIIETNKGIYETELVLTSQYPTKSTKNSKLDENQKDLENPNLIETGPKHGVPLTCVFFEMKKGFKWPDGVHTIIVPPNDVKSWYEKYFSSDKKQENSLKYFTDFGCHIFRDAFGNVSCFIFTPSDYKQENTDKTIIEHRIYASLKSEIPYFNISVEQCHVLFANELKSFNIYPYLPLYITDNKSSNQINNNSIIPIGNGYSISAALLSVQQAFDNKLVTDLIEFLIKGTKEAKEDNETKKATDEPKKEKNLNPSKDSISSNINEPSQITPLTTQPKPT